MISLKFKFVYVFILLYNGDSAKLILMLNHPTGIVSGYRAKDTRKKARIQIHQNYPDPSDPDPVPATKEEKEHDRMFCT